MARKSKTAVVEPVVISLDKVNDLPDHLKAMPVGATVELKHHRSKVIAQQIRGNGATLTAPVEHVRTFTLGEARFQWTNITYASAAKAGDPSKARRQIIRLS